MAEEKKAAESQPGPEPSDPRSPSQTGPAIDHETGEETEGVTIQPDWDTAGEEPVEEEK